MLRIADRIFETTTSSGTGDVTLAGAKSGYGAFSSALNINDTTHYTLAQGSSWEVGIGTLTTSTTLQRTVILASSSGGAAINLDGNPADVFITASAQLVGSIPKMELLTAGGTWYKPPFYKYAEMLLIGGAGGGQGGSTSSAGAGATSGGITRRTICLDELPSSVPYLVGAGGIGGIGAATAVTAGTNISATSQQGGVGGDTVFGNSTDAWFMEVRGGFTSATLGTRLETAGSGSLNAASGAARNSSESQANAQGGGHQGLVLVTSLSPTSTVEFLMPCGGTGGNGNATGSGYFGAQPFRQLNGNAYWGFRASAGGGSPVEWPITCPMPGSGGGGGAYNGAGAGGNGGNGSRFGGGGGGGGRGTTRGGDGGSGGQGLILFKYYGG